MSDAPPADSVPRRTPARRTGAARADAVPRMETVRVTEPDLLRRAALEKTRTRLVYAAFGFGLLFLAAGLGISWFFGLYPLQQAQAGAAQIKYDVKVFVAGPMLAASGLMLLVGGARVGRAFSGAPRTREQHLLVWPVFAVAMAAGGLGFWWFSAQLRALGYVTGY